MSENEESWTVVGRREVYRGRMRIEEHRIVLPTGESGRYEVDTSVPFAVAVLLIRGERVTLSRQYRHPLGRWIFDLPGGAGEMGEAPLEAAKRECREELGLDPLGLQSLHTVFPNPGRSAWPLHLFVATAAAPAEDDRSDPSEQVRSVEMRIAELDARILSGEIVDPALLIARALAGARGLLPALGAAEPRPLGRHPASPCTMSGE